MSFKHEGYLIRNTIKREPGYSGRQFFYIALILLQLLPLTPPSAYGVEDGSDECPELLLGYLEELKEIPLLGSLSSDARRSHPKNEPEITTEQIILTARALATQALLRCADAQCDDVSAVISDTQKGGQLKFFPQRLMLGLAYFAAIFGTSIGAGYISNQVIGNQEELKHYSNGVMTAAAVLSSAIFYPMGEPFIVPLTNWIRKISHLVYQGSTQWHRDRREYTEHDGAARGQNLNARLSTMVNFAKIQSEIRKGYYASAASHLGEEMRNMWRNFRAIGADSATIRDNLQSHLWGHAMDPVTGDRIKVSPEFFKMVADDLFGKAEGLGCPVRTDAACNLYFKEMFIAWMQGALVAEEITKKTNGSIGVSVSGNDKANGSINGKVNGNGKANGSVPPK